jgi:hypothetical protein
MAVARSSKSPKRHADHAAHLRRHGRRRARLVQAINGNLYGTTVTGGPRLVLIALDKSVVVGQAKSAPNLDSGARSVLPYGSGQLRGRDTVRSSLAWT